ncbi:BGTF surface domain-containing protein [Halohasta litorea]|uniref:BGTF surface domain-containing protein n=1 Tax=Halohasta litorea TaxID=869891 RepID=A0ABD6D639_9EURY|nr:BGTF surface domain-containing protein [Halohasta litorea]
MEVSRDNGDIDGTSLIGTLNPEATDDSTFTNYEVDTTDLETGAEYGISNTANYQSGNTEIVQTFSVISEGFSAEFDDSEVDGTDNASVIELDSDRQATDYNLTVSVDGPDSFDAEMIEDLFETKNGTTGTVTDSDDLPLDHLGYDREDGDNINDIRDDDYVTLNLDTLESNGTVSGSDLQMNVSNLENNAGLPDAGEYEFEFIVSDTGATATDTVSISESDEGASFSEGAVTDTAGDIATFEFELEDTDETWVQIGDEDSDFVEVLYVQADDEDEPVSISANTRLLGTDPGLDTEEVYDTENVDTIESGYHEAGPNGGTFQNVPDDAKLFGDDEGTSDSASNDYIDYITSDLSLSDEYDSQLTRPLQPTDYEIQIGGTDIDTEDESVFDASSGGEATDQLASAVLTLEQPTIGDITVHTAPSESANDETEVSELVDAATVRDEVAIEDRLIVQVEATGLYGGLVAGADGDTAANSDWDRLDDGVSSDVLYKFVEDTNESINFEVTAEESTGNQAPLKVNLEDGGDSDTFVVLDEENGQFFVVADTSSDSAFKNGDAPEEDVSFNAELEYDADNEDNRYEFATDQSPAPFGNADNAENYPYLAQGETLSSSAQFDLAPRSIDFDNVNVDDVLEAENIEDSEISGETNVAPGTDATIRVSSTEASSSFRNGQDVNITEDGSVSAEFDFSDQDVEDQFQTEYRVSGSSVDSVDSMLVEEGTLEDEAPEDDSSSDDSSSDDSSSDDSSSDDSSSDDSSSDDSASDDGESDDSSSEETPGFGAIVALVAVLGAALLATRRQN